MVSDGMARPFDVCERPGARLHIVRVNEHEAPI
jgi:hypothetical protein